MYAIIAESGRQYKVTGGDVIRIDREIGSLNEAQTVTFDQVLMVGGEGTPRIGTPTVASATVTGEVLRAVKGPKIEIIKYKRRKGYHKHKGHRQKQFEIRITGINV
jgi:large subunit ribosomal protein L21